MRIISWLSICFIVSSATPTVMSSAVPPNGNWLDVPEREHEQRRERDHREEQRAGQRDAVQHLGEVALGRRPGPDAGDEAALLADDVGLLLRVERDRRVEVREEDDQQRVEADVEPALVVHEVVVDPLLHARAALLPSADAISAGNDRIELAKITGITPDWLTFSGM